MSTVLIRPARAGDKEAVLAFTQNTWQWGDYIAYVWERWLSEPGGEMLVADVDGVVAGLTMTSLLPSGEGWLQGLRVHPGYRRQGLARLLTQRQIAYLHEHSAHVVRLAVHSHNVASQTHVENTGFRRVTSFSSFERATEAAGGDTGMEILRPDDSAAAWSMLSASPLFLATAGLWAERWVWQRLTADVLAHRIGQGLVGGLRAAEGGWASLALLDPGDEQLSAGYVDGDGAAIEAMARALAVEGGRRGKRGALAMLPPAPEIRAAFERAGYSAETDDSALYIYELELKAIWSEETV